MTGSINITQMEVSYDDDEDQENDDAVAAALKVFKSILNNTSSIQLKKNQKNNNEKCDQGNVDNSGTSAMFDTPLRSTVHHKDLTFNTPPTVVTFNTPPTVVQKPLNVLKKDRYDIKKSKFHDDEAADRNI